MKRITSLLILLLSFSFLYPQGVGYKNVDASKFKELISTDDGVIVDVRTEGEFKRGHIKNAKLMNLYDSSIKTMLLSLPKDKPVYIYCYSGNRSRHAAQFLVQNGYTQVYNLMRGTISWTAAGFSLEKTTEPVTAAAKQENAYTEEQFNQLVTSEGLVFVDFYAPWCAPCKELLPTIEELEKEYEGKVKIVKLNTDASKDLVAKQGLTSVPHLRLYKEGQIVFQRDGKASKEFLVHLFEENL